MDKENKSPLDYFTEDSFVGGGADSFDVDLQETSEAVAEEYLDEGGDLDSGWNMTSEEEVEDIVEDQEEEEVEVEEETKEEVESEVDPDVATRAFFFAEEFVKDGTLPEDFEFDENITGQDLKKALLENAVGDLDVEGYVKSQGYSEEVFDIAQSLVNGTPPDLLYESQRYKHISNLDLGEEDMAERILLEYYLDKGIDEDTANDIITSKVEDGSEVSEAKKAQEYFANKAHQLDEAEKAKVEARKQSLKEAKDGVINKIKSLSVGDLKLKKQEANELIDYLYKETEVDVINIDGKKHRRLVSKFKKDYDAHTKDSDQFIKFAYNMMKGFDVEAIKQNSVIEAATKQIDALNKRTSTKTTEKRKAVDLFSGFQQLA